MRDGNGTRYCYRPYLLKIVIMVTRIRQYLLHIIAVTHALLSTEDVFYVSHVSIMMLLLYTVCPILKIANREN